jgi:hypothetical protein
MFGMRSFHEMGRSAFRTIEGLLEEEAASFPVAAGVDCPQARGSVPARIKERYIPKILEQPVLTG